MREALLDVGLGGHRLATLVALVLGTLLAFALGRYQFFGRESLSLLVILPIALPGIVTGIALNNVFTTFLGGLTIYTLIIGHATFCIVVVYNNAIARHPPHGRQRRGGVGRPRRERLADLRLRHVPADAVGALVAGAILAFGLSFDEIIVTTFTAGPGVTTLPIWIYQNLFRPNQAPIVNVVAAALVLVSILPIYIAQRFSNADERGGGLI